MTNDRMHGIFWTLVGAAVAIDLHEEPIERTPGPPVETVAYASMTITVLRGQTSAPAVIRVGDVFRITGT